MTWADDVRRANEALDWIEARQGPLPATNYARIETDVRTVRAMAEGQDERISEWSESDELLRWTLEQHTRSLNNAGEQRCAQCYTRIPCDIAALAASGLDRSARLDALAAERDELKRAYEQAARWHGHYVESVSDHDALAARLAATEAALERWSRLSERLAWHLSDQLHVAKFRFKAGGYGPASSYGDDGSKALADFRALVPEGMTVPRDYEGRESVG